MRKFIGHIILKRKFIVIPIKHVTSIYKCLEALILPVWIFEDRQHFMTFAWLLKEKMIHWDDLWLGPHMMQKICGQIRVQFSRILHRMHRITKSEDGMWLTYFPCHWKVEILFDLFDVHCSSCLENSGIFYVCLSHLFLYLHISNIQLGQIFLCFQWCKLELKCMICLQGTIHVYMRGLSITSRVAHYSLFLNTYY